MFFYNTNNAAALFVYLLTLIIVSSVHSLPRRIEDHQPVLKLKTIEYKRFASHCYIDDYPAWLERQQELLVWLQLTKLLRLPIQDANAIRQELEQFRLQRECLRVIERLPLTIGPG